MGEHFVTETKSVSWAKRPQQEASRLGESGIVIKDSQMAATSELRLMARALAEQDENWRGLPRDGASQHRSKMPCPFTGQSRAHESQPHPQENTLERTVDRGWVWNLVLILGIQ